MSAALEYIDRQGTLAGQVALVSGGGRGLGRAFARALAAAGAAVAVAARSPIEVEETAAHITAAGGCALALPLDVTDYAAVATLSPPSSASSAPSTSSSTTPGSPVPSAPSPPWIPPPGATPST